MIPVWKDTDWMVDATQQVEYDIENVSSGEYEFSGIAHPKPNQENISVRISEFAKNMVNSDCELYFYEFGESFPIQDYCNKIRLVIDGIGFEENYFINNYDYNEPSIQMIPHIIGKQIGKITDKGNYLFTIFNPTDEDCTISIYERNSADFISWYEDLDLYAKEARVYCVYNLSLDNLIIEVDGTAIANFKIEKSCHQYNLHYLNAAGGYSTLTLEGRKGKRTDDFVFDYYKTRGRNDDYNQPQMHKYKVDITPKWDVQTGWLSEDDSKRMYNIFGSQKVWLEDIETAEIFPVYITNTNCEYKTFTNQGRKKYNYTFSLTCANTLIKL